jgi:hypothetical protein
VNTDAVDDRNADGGAIEARMGSHVEGIMSAARKAAAQFQAEVERAANERAAQIETAAARRAHAVRMGAEAEAEQLVVQSRAATQQYVTASRRLVDEFARERMTRIAEVADRLAVQAEALLEPLARSEELARQLDELRTALGTAAKRIAIEAGRESPELPDLPIVASIVEPAGDAGETAGDDDAASSSASLEERLARATGRPRKRLATAPDEPPDSAAGEEVPEASRMPTGAAGDGRRTRRSVADELRLLAGEDQRSSERGPRREPDRED